MLAKLPGWVVDDVTSVREEVADWIGMSAAQRWRLAVLCGATRCGLRVPAGIHSGSWTRSTRCLTARLRRSRACDGRPDGAMPTAERGAAEAAQRIADAFEAGGISYAIGGALALAIAGVPRGTADVDVNVFVSAVALTRLFMEAA